MTRGPRNREQAPMTLIGGREARRLLSSTQTAGQRPDMRVMLACTVRIVRFWERRCPILGADLEPFRSVQVPGTHAWQGGMIAAYMR